MAGVVSWCRADSHALASARPPAPGSVRALPRGPAPSRPRPRGVSCHALAAPPPELLASRGRDTEVPTAHHLPADWLEQTVRKLVEEAGDRPVLHCVRAAPGGRLMHERYAVERSVARAPELWPCIADHLASAHPDVLLMVQRLASPALACRLSQESRACPEASCAPSLPALIVGEVDEECCHSVGDTHGHHHHHHQSAPRVVFDEESKVFRDAFRKSLEETASKRDTSAQYYGVVVQARSRAASWSGSGSAASALDSEGCYLLKVVSSTAADCRCSHYSLVRLCQGDPLSQQQWRPFLLS